MKFSESNGANVWTKFYDKDEWICITTNSYIKTNGELTMGIGIARDAVNRFPGIAYGLGQVVKKCGNIPLVNTKYRLITLPTKNHWKDDADLLLIEESLKTLVQIVTKLGLQKIYLPRPGCGNGNLDWEAQVKPLCGQYLDHRFVVCSSGRKLD